LDRLIKENRRNIILCVFTVRRHCQ